MDNWQAELNQLLFDHLQAESDADRELAARREEVTTFIDQVVLPTYTDLSTAFSRHGQGRQAQFSRDTSADRPALRLTVRGPLPDATEFVYELNVIVEPRRLILWKQITDTEKYRETPSLGELKRADFASVALAQSPVPQIAKEDIIADFLHDYRAHLEGIRR